MARFRGTVQGGRGMASRLGHGTTGLQTLAQSYSGDVAITMWVVDGKDHVRIGVTSHGDRSSGITVYDGLIKDLLDQSARKTMITALAADILING